MFEPGQPKLLHISRAHTELVLNPLFLYLRFSGGSRNLPKLSRATGIPIPDNHTTLIKPLN